MKTKENYLSTDNGSMQKKERKNLDNWRKAWVKALRSGKYKQVQGALKDGNRFCCLGVLADLAAKAGHGYWLGNDYCIKELQESGPLPLAGDAIWEGEGKDNINLVRLNDTLNYNFKQIAKVIEARKILLPNGAIL